MSRHQNESGRRLKNARGHVFHVAQIDLLEPECSSMGRPGTGYRESGHSSGLSGSTLVFQRMVVVSIRPLRNSTGVSLSMPACLTEEAAARQSSGKGETRKWKPA